MMPVTAIACQTRRLDAENGSHLTTAHFGNQALESGTLYKARARAPEIIVDYGDIREAQLAGSVHKSVLATLALLIVDDLPRAGLANIDDSAARKALSVKLRVHLRLRSSCFLVLR
jgi:hypothetical protein